MLIVYLGVRKALSKLVIRVVERQHENAVWSTVWRHMVDYYLRNMQFYLVVPA